MINEDNHFNFLLVCYSIDNGQILHRYSCKTYQEAENFCEVLKGQGDIIIQKMDHWVVLP